MSYILDALRRAEAERERGRVPHLHAQPANVVAAAPAAGLPRGIVVAAAVAVAASVAGAVWWRSAADAPAPVALAPSPTLPPSPPTVVPPAAGLPANPVEPPAAPAPLPVLVSAPPPAPPPPAPPPPAAAPAPAAQATPAAAGGAATSPAVPLSTLTAAQRRDWPPLAVGGVVYSDNPASRFIIVDGQLVREGEAVAPGVTVERIGPRSATVAGRAGRVELTY